jgi:RNA polymerase sigma-70 factor (ECF subfamily)
MEGDVSVVGVSELRELYGRYAPLVYSCAHRILGREADAWDAVQEVFSRLLESNTRFRGEARPMTYLYRATTNVCLNLLRARCLREPTNASEPSALEPSAEPGEVEARDFIRALATQLSERACQVAILYYLDRLTQDELADVLGLSRKTIQRELDRIRACADALELTPALEPSHA